MTEDEMVGWHQGLDGHEFEQALGDGQGQGILVCCSPQGRNESDMTEQLNNNKKSPFLASSVGQIIYIYVCPLFSVLLMSILVF